MRAELSQVSPSVLRVSWPSTLPDHVRECAEVVGVAVAEALAGGCLRVEAYVDPIDLTAQRVATFSGLRKEGVARGVADGEDRIVYGRLSSDVPADRPEGFRALLNSFLPRKRAISQLLVLSTDGGVLLCQLTYKQDWDLPGGVVEVGESPQLAGVREVQEELGLVLEPGPLLLTDWLPPWGGWDDAVCLVFDGGTHPSSIVESFVRQEREIRATAFCTPEEVTERCADFTARRVFAALANLDGGGPAYVESGRA